MRKQAMERFSLARKWAKEAHQNVQVGMLRHGVDTERVFWYNVDKRSIQWARKLRGMKEHSWVSSGCRMA